MGKPAHFSTKDRILGAAEELFAQHGFAGTSLRQVTSLAAVNIAAVNYHFGSKENLVNEVFRRRMDDMTALRLSQLKLALAQDRNGGASFVRVIARAYAEHNESLRKFLSDHYGHVLREFGKALAGCLPGLDKETLYWRLDFLAGSLTYAMSDFGLIKRPAGASEATHRARAARELIRFSAAGLQTSAK